jgi:hypothetical protein
MISLCSKDCIYELQRAERLGFFPWFPHISHPFSHPKEVAGYSDQSCSSSGLENFIEACLTNPCLSFHLAKKFLKLFLNWEARFINLNRCLETQSP